MDEQEKKVRITVTVDEQTAVKIAELAARMNASQSRMASWLLEAGVEDNEWVIKIVTSKVVSGLRETLSGICGRTKSAEKAA